MVAAAGTRMRLVVVPVVVVMVLAMLVLDVAMFGAGSMGVAAAAAAWKMRPVKVESVSESMAAAAASPAPAATSSSNSWDPSLATTLTYTHDHIVSVLYDASTNTWSWKNETVVLDAVALAFHNSTLNVTGWDTLRVYTNGAYDDHTQLYGAGVAEGFVSDASIYDLNWNMMEFYFGSSSREEGGTTAGAPAQPPSALMDWLTAQDAWTAAEIAAHAGNLNASKVWRGIDLFNQQLTGLVLGYNAGAFGSLHPLSRTMFLLINAMGDLDDLLPIVDPITHPRPRWFEWDAARIVDELRARRAHASRCSALVRVNGDLSTLLSAHSTWFSYSSMNRAYKFYYFELHDADAASRRLSFSSYPGYLESVDDFYVLDSGLVVLETSNSIYNMSLYDLVTPKSLIAWQRVRLANLYARGGEEWVELFRTHNSGTYNNQYMIVDYKRFTPGQPLLPGTLWVCEQIPGLVMGADVTRQLERGYWSSYNVPYFPEIFDLSGYPTMVAQLGVSQTYQLAPRANIFRRDVGHVVNITTLQAIMRYNNYLHDPYAQGNAWSAICSRGDLNATAPSPDGCYDTKTTNEQLVAEGSAWALNGPTTGGGGGLSPNDPDALLPFDWSDPRWSALPHRGQPTRWVFDFVHMHGMW